MAAAVKLRTDDSALDLRRLAAGSRHANQTRRLLSLAAVLEGMVGSRRRWRCPLFALVHNWTPFSLWPLRVRVANSFGVRPPRLVWGRWVL